MMVGRDSGCWGSFCLMRVIFLANNFLDLRSLITDEGSLFCLFFLETGGGNGKKLSQHDSTNTLVRSLACSSVFNCLKSDSGTEVSLYSTFWLNPE